MKIFKSAIAARYQRVMTHRQDESDDEENNVDNSGNGADESSNKPSESEAKLLKEVMAKKERITNLSTQIDSQASALTELQEKMKAFDNVDPSKYAAMLKSEGEQKEKELVDGKDWEALKVNMMTSFASEKKQMSEAHNTALEASETGSATKMTELTDQLQKSNALIENLTVGAAFSSSKFVADDLVPQALQVRRLYGEHFDADGEKVVAYDKPRGSADRAKLVDANGSSLSFDAAIQKIVDSDPSGESIVRSKQKSGANGDSQNTNGKVEVARGLGRITAGLKNKS